MISPETLRRYPYFASIDEVSLKMIAMAAEEKTIPAGEQMFQEGDPADTLHIITHGEVHIQYLLGSGELRTVDTLVDGDLLCWSSLVEPYKVTGIGTTGKETHLIAVEAKRVRELCAADPELGCGLMTEIAKLLANRLRNARVQLAAAE